MKVKELLKKIDEKFNFDNQEEWDHCGFNNVFNVESANIENICICLDINKTIINKCIENNINIIISHHPLYIGDQSLLKQYELNYILEIQKMLSDNNIFHIVLHTCFDMFEQGTSYQVFKKISKCTTWESKPIPNSKYSIYFELEDAMPLSIFLQLIRNKQICSRIIVKKQQLETSVKTIAICAGSGFSELQTILDSEPKIDCFLTGDLKWHNYQLETNTILIDIGHDVEKVFIDYIYDFLISNCELDDNCSIEKIYPEQIINFLTYNDF